jgi:MFS transporter, putative metabolite:H+ symporter
VSQTNSIHSIAERIERLPVGGFHRRFITLVSLGNFFDLYDIFVVAYIGAALQQSGFLSLRQFTVFVASGFLGMFVGTIVFGMGSDRAGRRRAFMTLLLIYSLFTLSCAFAPSAPWLIVLRFFAGTGIGAEIVVIDTYVTEMVPSRARGRYVAITQVAGFCAVPVVAILARLLVPTHFLFAGWRWVMVIGSAGAMLTWWFRQRLPESPRWLASQGRLAQAEAVLAGLEAESFAAKERSGPSPTGLGVNKGPSAQSDQGKPEPSDERRDGAGEVLVEPATRRMPFATQGKPAPFVRSDQGVAERHVLSKADQTAAVASNETATEADTTAERGSFAELWRRPYLGRTVMLIFFQALQTIGFYGFSNWAPTFLLKRGFSLLHSLEYTMLIALVSPIGPLVGAVTSDRLERKWTIVALATGVALFGLGFAAAKTPVMVIVFGALLTLANYWFSAAFHAYQAEMFPTRIRATGVGFTYSWSRLSAAFSSILVAVVLVRGGVSAVFMLLAAAMGGVALIIGALGPRTNKIALEQLAK